MGSIQRQWINEDKSEARKRWTYSNAERNKDRAIIASRCPSGQLRFFWSITINERPELTSILLLASGFR